ncbi:flagellin N-terminal helical domain-containing protein [Granulicella arctica]|uniref:flagellin N-terminal helical domain-containing protein n=1 Tax=Granulicella arctica TaxID=940613 RepID=UPI0021E02420|nr:flagellin [Granulicella arctica]
MSLGVLNNIAAIYANNNINNTQASLQNTLTQLSSGSRINSGADDAAGLAVADGLHANEAALTQSAQNAQQGIGLLQTADGALSQVTNLLNRAVTLATEAANSTLNSSQVSSANQEYQNIITEIGNIGSTTNYNGNTVFSNTATNLFVSDGTTSGANVYSDVVGALSGASVGVVAALGTTTSTTFQNPVANASTATVKSTVTYAAATSSDALSGTLTIAVGAGTAFSVSITAGSTIAQTIAQLTSSTAFTTTNSLVATQGTGANANQLIITGAVGAAGAATLSLSGSALSDTTATAGVAVVNPTPTASTTTTGATATFALAAKTDTLNGAFSVTVAGGTAITATFASGTSLAAAATQLNAQTTFKAAGLVASVGTGVNANKLIVTGPADTGTAGTNALVLTSTAIKDETTPPAGAGIDFTSAKIATLSNATAQDVLTSVTSAIGDVAYQRGILGANINELTAASNVASSESENLTSAESNIRSTNYGQATSDLAKYQVLSQTGISALAQANSVQQEILKLLQ